MDADRCREKALRLEEENLAEAQEGQHPASVYNDFYQIPAGLPMWHSETEC